MNVASLELCKELYELSGWTTDRRVSVNTGTSADGHYYLYDLGYLLRKLPHFNINLTDEGQYVIWWDKFDGREVADTPEDVAARLAVELFKQGVLKRES